MENVAAIGENTLNTVMNSLDDVMMNLSRPDSNRSHAAKIQHKRADHRGPEAESGNCCYHGYDVYDPGRDEPQQVFCVTDNRIVAPVQIDQYERRAGNGGKGAGKGGEKRFALRSEVGRETDNHPTQQKVDGVLHEVVHDASSLSRIFHDGSSRNRAVALRDGHAEARGPEAYLNSTSRERATSLPAEGSSQQRIRGCSRSAHE
jgi:hypothetical protein